MCKSQMKSKSKETGILLLFLLLWSGFSSCSDSPTPVKAPEDSPQAGKVSFSIPLSKVAAASLARAEVVITASDMTEIRRDLIISGDTVTGSVQGIPAGNSRLFTLNGYDVVGNLIYTGSTQVNLPAGEVVPVNITMRRVGGDTAVATNGRVWFLSPKTVGGRDYEIWSMESDGSNAKKEVELTFGYQYRHFSINPDGTEIVFVHAENSNGPYKLKLRNTSGGLVSEIFDGGFNTLSSIKRSPDGNKIAFVSDDSPDVLVIMDSRAFSFLFNSSLPQPSDFDTKITNTIYSLLGVTWSPDGSQMYITSNYSSSFGSIYVMKSDGTGLRGISNASDCGPVAFSPDGSLIAYARRDKGVFLAKPDGTREAQLSTQKAYNITWSPDGKEIFFDGQTDNVALYKINIDGTAFQTVNPQGTGRFAPWYPVWVKR